MKKDKTRYISEESQVPEGWVPLASIVPPEDRNLRRLMTDAHRTGRVAAVKLVRSEGDIRTGRVWMHPEQAAAFIQRHRVGTQEPSESRQADDLVSSLSRDIAGLREAIQNLQAAIELYGAAK